MAALMVDNWQGLSLSLDSQKQVPPPFLTKTYHLVDDPNTDHIVSWGGDQHSTFVVWRPPEFARDLLPNYFKHSNFSSFVRQLNTYGFRKIVPDRWEFANEFFKKGEMQLLCEIHRRKTSHPPQMDGTYFRNYATRLSVSPPDSDNDPSLAWLSEDNERLRKSNSLLVSDLAHMRKLYTDVIYLVQNHVKPVSPSSWYSSSLFQTQQPLMPHEQKSCSVQVGPSSQSIDHDAAEAVGCCMTKLFGVPLLSNKRSHFSSSSSKDELSFNLML